MSYSDLRKNRKYQTGCSGSLYFNPTIVGKTQLTFDYYYSVIAASVLKATTTEISEGDIVSFGGQFGGFVLDVDATAGTISIHVPEETFPDMSTELGNILTKYVNNYDYIYAFKPNYDVAYSYGTNDFGTGYTKYPDTCIENVRIREYSETVKRKTFGFHRKQYDILTEYPATLEIPPDVDKMKIDQMLNSDAVIFVPDDRSVSIVSLPTGWVFDKPHGGGSVNPIVRKISIKTDTMKYGLRRGYQLLDVILEG